MKSPNHPESVEPQPADLAPSSRRAGDSPTDESCSGADCVEPGDDEQPYCEECHASRLDYFLMHGDYILCEACYDALYEGNRLMRAAAEALESHNPNSTSYYYQGIHWAHGCRHWEGICHVEERDFAAPTICRMLEAYIEAGAPDSFEEFRDGWIRFNCKDPSPTVVDFEIDRI